MRVMSSMAASQDQTRGWGVGVGGWGGVGVRGAQKHILAQPWWMRTTNASGVCPPPTTTTPSKFSSTNQPHALSCLTMAPSLAAAPSIPNGSTSRQRQRQQQGRKGRCLGTTFEERPCANHSHLVCGRPAPHQSPPAPLPPPADTKGSRSTWAPPCQLSCPFETSTPPAPTPARAKAQARQAQGAVPPPFPLLHPPNPQAHPPPRTSGCCASENMDQVSTAAVVSCPAISIVIRSSRSCLASRSASLTSTRNRSREASPVCKKEGGGEFGA